MLKKIDAEIAFANAARLTNVTLDIAPAQGTSTPTAGLIIDDKFRKGFGYTLNYNPSAEYHFFRWEAEYKDEENNWKLADESIVKFDPLDKPITSVIVNTVAPIILRPKAERRPFIENTNLSWEGDSFIDFVARVKFSRPMDPASFTWDTVIITGIDNSGTITYKGDTFTDFPKFIGDDNSVLELEPKGLVSIRANSRITIRFMRMVDTDIGIQSCVESGGIPLAEDIVLRYNTNNRRSPKPRFDERKPGGHHVRFATRSDNVWTVWDDNDYSNRNLAHRVPSNGQVYIVFLPDEDTAVSGIRITETWIRKPRINNNSDPIVDDEISYSFTFVPVSRNNIERSLAEVSGFPAGSDPIAVSYTLKAPNKHNILNHNDIFGGVRLKVELYNGVSYSEGDEGAPEGPQIIKTKCSPEDALKRITGANTSSTINIFLGMSLHQVIISDKTVSTGKHSLPFSITDDIVFTRNVNIPNYSLDEIPVTEELWSFVRNWALSRTTNPYSNISAGSSIGDHFPVTNVSWRDVIVWCNALSEINGLDPVYLRYGVVIRNTSNITASNHDLVTINTSANGFRLPSDIEWDYAARGGNGTTTTITLWNFIYSGSNTASDVANFSGTIQPVRQRTANNLGLYDMSGNVDEWVWDRNGTTDATTPITGPVDGDNRVFRGGDFSTTGNSQRLGDARGDAAIDSAADTRGFRVARNGH